MATKKAVKKAEAVSVQSNEAQELKCLGHIGLQLAIYSQVLKQVVFPRMEQLTSKFLMLACGLDWLVENFGPKVGGAAPNSFGFDEGMAVKYLVSECQSAGPFSHARVRPEGVYREGEAIVVNTGDELFRISGDSSSPSREELCAYTQVDKGLGVRADTVCADRKDVSLLEQFIGNWIFREAIASIILLGWFVLTIFSGALDRRPHLAVTGARGLGKTMLRDGVGGLYGPAALLVDGDSTLSGISQALAGRPIPVLVDEAEIHAKPWLRDVVRAARSWYSSSGDGRVVGSGSGKARSAPIVSPVWFSCVQPPNFEASDASRWLMVEVTGLKPEAAANPSQFSLDANFRAEIGARLRMLVLRRWPTFRKSLPVFRAVLLKKVGDARLAETLAPVFTGYWVLKHGNPATPADAEKLTKKLPPTVDGSTEQVVDEFECLNSLLTKLIAVRGMHGEGKVSVAEMVQRVRGGDKLCDIQLQRLGIRVLCKADGEWVMSVPVSTSHQGLHTLFAGTRWVKGNWGAVLLRLPGASKTTQQVLNVYTKVVEFPLPVEPVQPAANGEVLKKAA